MSVDPRKSLERRESPSGNAAYLADQLRSQLGRERPTLGFLDRVKGMTNRVIRINFLLQIRSGATLSITHRGGPLDQFATSADLFLQKLATLKSQSEDEDYDALERAANVFYDQIHQEPTSPFLTDEIKKLAWEIMSLSHPPKVETGVSREVSDRIAMLLHYLSQVETQLNIHRATMKTDDIPALGKSPILAMQAFKETLLKCKSGQDDLQSLQDATIKFGVFLGNDPIFKRLPDSDQTIVKIINAAFGNARNDRLEHTNSILLAPDSQHQGLRLDSGDEPWFDLRQPADELNLDLEGEALHVYDIQAASKFLELLQNLDQALLPMQLHKLDEGILRMIRALHDKLENLWQEGRAAFVDSKDKDSIIFSSQRLKFNQKLEDILTDLNLLRGHGILSRTSYRNPESSNELRRQYLKIFSKSEDR